MSCTEVKSTGNKIMVRLMKNEEDAGLIDLASDNQDLKHKIAVILTKLESTGVTDLEEQVSVLMKNMMNYFAKNVEEIPAFESLSLEQQQALLFKFKKVAHSLKSRKISSIDEMLQTFVFTVLSSLGEGIEGVEHLTAAEIMNKKSKHGFRAFLRKAASYEIYKLTHAETQTTEASLGRNFINNAVLLGVKKAMHHAGLELNQNSIDKEAYLILDTAHNDLVKAQKNKVLTK